MNEKVITSERNVFRETSKFLVVVGLLQGFDLSPYLLSLVMDNSVVDTQDEVPLNVACK